MIHAGPHQSLFTLRSRYWITSSRNLCRKLYRDCIFCFRYPLKTSHLVVSDLPNFRLEQAFPFQYESVGFAGPASIKIKKGRGAKSTNAYIYLSVCFVTTAMHLELVTSLSTEAFMKILPATCFRQRNKFRGTNNFLKNSGNCLKDSKNPVITLASQTDIQWLVSGG